MNAQVSVEIERLFGESAKPPAHVLSLDSTVSDLVMCIVGDTNKREKRLNRLRILLDNAADRMSPSVRDFAQSTLKKFSRNNAGTSPASSLSDCEKRQMLLNHFQNAGDPSTSSRIQKTSSKPYNVMDEISGRATKILNADGHVHRVSAHAAVLALERVRKMPMPTKTLAAMVKGMKLVLKGGVAAGKYHLSGVSEAHTAFVSGGDNDTCLKFPDIPRRNNETDVAFRRRYSSMQMYVLQKYMNEIVRVLDQFRVAEDLSSHLDLLDGASMEVFGERVVLRPMPRKSFAVQNSLLYRNEFTRTIKHLHRPKNLLYSTLSSLSFENMEGIVFDFHLGRIKVGVMACIPRLGLCVPSHAEFLDVSVVTPFDTSPKPETSEVALDAFLRN